MHTTKKIVRTSALALCFFCSACANMQQQIDANSRELAQMREKMARSHSDIEQLRSELQALSGTLDESNVVQNQEIKDIKGRLDSITSMIKNPVMETEEPVTPPVAEAPPAPVNNEQAHYDRALELYYGRDYEKSRSSFQAFIKQYNGSPLAQNAFFWIGMSLFQQKDYRKSITAFEDLIKEFPQGTKVPDSYYWQAMAFIELKEMLTAQILLETLMQTYPTSEASQRGKAKYQELKLDKSR